MALTDDEQKIVASAAQFLQDHRQTIESQLAQDLGRVDLDGYNKLVIELFPPQFGVTIFKCTADDGDCVAISQPIASITDAQASSEGLEIVMLHTFTTFFVELMNEPAVAPLSELPVFIGLHDGDERPL